MPLTITSRQQPLLGKNRQLFKLSHKSQVLMVSSNGDTTATLYPAEKIHLLGVKKLSVDYLQK